MEDVNASSLCGLLVKLVSQRMHQWNWRRVEVWTCTDHVIHHFHLCEQTHITCLASQRMLVTMLKTGSYKKWGVPPTFDSVMI